MKKITILLLILSVMASAFFIGCSDDDDNPLGSSLKPLLIAGGVYISNGRLSGYLEFWDASSSGKQLDSAKFGDNITMTDFESWYWVGDDNYYGRSLYYYYDSGYVSGDTINIKLYDEGTMAELDLILYDNSFDSVTLVTTPTFPVALNSTNDIAWTSFPMADFYTLSVGHYWYDTEGGYHSKYRSYTTVDTTFTIPDEFTSIDGNMSFQVAPYSGNVPTGAGIIEPNVETSTMAGNIWTYGDWVYRNGQVGAGSSAPPASLKINNDREIIKLNNELIFGK